MKNENEEMKLSKGLVGVLLLIGGSVGFIISFLLNSLYGEIGFLVIMLIGYVLLYKKTKKKKLEYNQVLDKYNKVNKVFWFVLVVTAVYCFILLFKTRLTYLDALMGFVVMIIFFGLFFHKKKLEKKLSE